MKRKINSIIIAGILVFSFVALVHASGIAAPYWSDNPLKLSPGQSDKVTLALENNDTESVIFNATVTSDGNIATISKSIYEVPAGNTNTPVEIEVSVPEGIETGKVYQVSLSLQQISNGTGMVHVAGAVTTTFPVYVVPEEQSVLYNPPATQNSGLAWWIFAIIIVGIVVLIFASVKISKSKKRGKKN